MTQPQSSPDTAHSSAPGIDRPEIDRAAIDRLGFDEALVELQKTVAELEAGGQPLERSLALYERGVALHERCAKLLTDAELRLKQLVSQAGGALAAIDVAAERASEELADSP
jgi:exodeoxyribonuclease VII small subunit